MRTVGVVQLKGGAGRTTLATNLAVGLSAVLVDADQPQGTATAWGALRPSGSPQVVPADNHRQLVERLEELQRQGSAVVVVDAPPRVAEITRALLVLADVVLIPVGPSLADLWACGDLLETVSEASRENRRLTVRLVWNRFRPYTASADKLRKETRRELDVPALSSTLGYRVAYSDALGAGLSVLEYHNAKAREEMQALVAEVKRLLR